MKILHAYPPNYETIRALLPVTQYNIYCYGDIIYNPSNSQIPEDIIFHESIHKRQQGDRVEQWWNRYLIDTDFRYEQELEAYAEQYNFLRPHVSARVAKDALYELAKNLSSLYNIDITLQEAESNIRNYGGRKKDTRRQGTL